MNRGELWYTASFPKFQNLGADPRKFSVLDASRAVVLCVFSQRKSSVCSASFIILESPLRVVGRLSTISIGPQKVNFSPFAVLSHPEKVYSYSTCSS